MKHVTVGQRILLEMMSKGNFLILMGKELGSMCQWQNEYYQDPGNRTGARDPRIHSDPIFHRMFQGSL